MFTRWLIMLETINMNDGYNAELIKDIDSKPLDEHSATQKFYDVLSQYGKNPAVKYLRVRLLNPNGATEDMKVIDNHVEESDI